MVNRFYPWLSGYDELSEDTEIILETITVAMHAGWVLRKKTWTKFTVTRFPRAISFGKLLLSILIEATQTKKCRQKLSLFLE